MNIVQIYSLCITLTHTHTKQLTARVEITASAPTVETTAPAYAAPALAVTLRSVPVALTASVAPTVNAQNVEQPPRVPVERPVCA